MKKIIFIIFLFIVFPLATQAEEKNTITATLKVAKTVNIIRITGMYAFWEVDPKLFPEEYNRRFCQGLPDEYCPKL